GFNSRLDELQAAFLRAKLPSLVTLNARRAAVARIYTERLAGLPQLTLPKLAPGHVWHLYVVRHPQRDRLRQALLARGIEMDIHYPKPPHLQNAYAALGYHEGDFPIAEQIHREILSLPMHPFLSGDEVDYVCEAVRKFCAVNG